MTERVGIKDLYGSTLEPSTLPLGQAAPDAESLILAQGVVETFGSNIAREADALGFARGSTFLGEEGLRVGLGT
jgi:hypothetical protein